MLEWYDYGFCLYLIGDNTTMMLEAKELSCLTDKFAYTIDRAYERGTDFGLSDEEFKIETSDAYDEWLYNKV